MPRKVRKDLIDITGLKIGDWTVLHRAPDRVCPSQRIVMWWCRCSCGKEAAVYGFHLRAGRTHRCFDCRYRKMLRYKVGDRLGTRTLLYYMPDRRPDHDHGYWAWRCDCGATGKCTTPAAFKTRRCLACMPRGEYGNIVPIVINGVSRSASSWGKVFGLSRQTIWHRISMGWPPEKAVTEPTLMSCRRRKAQ